MQGRSTAKNVLTTIARKGRNRNGQHFSSQKKTDARSQWNDCEQMEGVWIGLMFPMLLAMKTVSIRVFVTSFTISHADEFSCHVMKPRGSLFRVILVLSEEVGHQIHKWQKGKKGETFVVAAQIRSSPFPIPRRRKICG